MHNSSQLEAALVQELDFLKPGAVFVLGSPHLDVVIGVAPSVFSWLEPRALCELVVEVARALQPAAAAVVWLLDEDAFARASGLLGEQLRRGTLAWLARLSSAGFETRALAQAEETWGRTAVELAGLAAGLLRLPALSPAEGLFARGVDSVLCVRLMAHVRERWGVELELRDVLDAPRIADLALRIDQLQAKGGAATSQIERVARDRAWPLSAAQLRMWLLSSLAEAGPAQHVTGGLRLSGVLDRVALQRAAERLAARHESLRTVFEEQAGVPMQRVLAEMPVAFRVEPATLLDDAACVRAAAEPAFDFARGPLWRISLYERAAGEHLMVLCMHHVISDGWSMELAARELLQLYAGEVELPALEVQYLDYVAWERAQEARLAEQIAYWRAQLVAELPPFELPRRLPRKQRAARSGRAGRSVAVELDPALIAQLRMLAAEQHSSLFAVLLAGYQLWLSRVTGRGQIRVGVPVLGRQRAAAEHLIGCFVNTLVLSLDVEPSHDVATLVRTVDASLRGALAHADVPFETLVRELGAQRSAEHTPLFQVTYNHLRVSEPTAIAGLRVERLAREPVGSPFVLSLESEEFADGSVRALFNYPVETFAPETVRELAELYVGLLWQMVSGSQRRVVELPLLSHAELMQLSAAHQTHTSILPDEPIHELVVRQALRRPDACALVGAGERWSFAELEQQSRALALSLRAQGVGPDVPVGIYVPRGPRMIVAALGILRAGGAYVPLDMSYPAERLAFIMRDSQIELVLCQSEADGDVLADIGSAAGRSASDGRAGARHAVRCLALDAGTSCELLPHVPVHPEQLAYVIYTSGSTGVPKGVGVGHGSLQMHLRATGALYDFDERDCALHFSSFSFDAAVENWALPLTHGARLVISDAEAWTGAQTYDVVRREGVNVVFPPTAHLRLLSQHVLDAGAAGQILRAVCVGGEAVLREDHALIMRALGPERFINGYGPTECVITPLLWRSFAKETPEQSYAPIGRPVGERRVYLLDAELMPVPVGVVGEVYIAGGHARGYHARPGLTAESFVPDPFAEAAGGRMYRTGDLGRWLPSGDVEYVGRRDAQVKLRGFRIELGEIESCLRQFADVSDAVVVLHEAAGNKRLVGYVELPNGGDVNALRAHASASLPEYMVPAQILVLSALPKTPNGKVDRRALPEPGAAERSRYAAPETELERALACIWSDVLGIEAVGLDDNFFELGGDSIIALQLVGRARAERLALHVRSVFEHQTLRALARACREQAPLAAAVVAPQAGRVSLTPIQRIFFGLALPNPSHFNQALLLGLRRSIDPSVLSEALSMLVLRHPALRLCLRHEGPRYLPSEELERDHLLEVCDVTSDAHALAVIQAAQRSLDLSQGQLLRAVLLREPARQRLLLVVHHLASDGVSLRVLLEELASACESLAAGGAPLLDAPSVDPGRWAERLEAWSKEDSLLEQRAFWSEQLHRGALQGVPPICDRVGECQALSLRLDVERTTKLLREAGRPLRLRTNELLLTALVRAVQCWNGQTSLSVQLEGHGRDSRWSDLDPSRSVGWFTCVYPLALDYHDEVGANLRAVKERVRSVPDAGLGYGVLTQLAGGELVNAAPSVTFNYLGQLDDSFDARRSPFELLSIGPGDSVDPAASAASPIVIDAWVVGGELSLRWTVSPSALPLTAARSLLAAFERELHDVIVQAAVAAPGLTPSDLPHVQLHQAELDALPFAPGAIEHVYPTSALQQGMLFHAATEPDSSAYVNALAFELRGVTPVALERAFRAAVTRHSALRSGFVWQEQPEPLQVVLAHAELPVQHADLTGALDLAAARARAIESERARSFQLQAAPLARLYLGQLPDARVLVIWTSHHLALDGWSAARLLAEVLADASGVARPAAPVLEHDAILAWRAQYASADSESFWRTQLRDLEDACLLAPQLPERGGVSRTAAGSGGEIAFRLAGASYEELRRCAQALHVTPNTLIQAAWLLLLERYTGRAVVSCGVTVSGRPAELPGSESLIGMYINTLPLVHRIEAAERVDAWLTRLMRENLALREHEHSALSDIQRWAALPGRALFDSLVVFENYPIEEALRGANQALAPAALEVFEETSFAFTLRVQQAQAALDFVLAYPVARLDAEEATRLGERFTRVLAQIASEPERRVGEIALVDGTDKTRLAELDATAHALPEAAFVADWICVQAQARPTATALVFDGVSRSYGELEARSTRLARRLRDLGVRSDARVALLAERSFELVESLYAVLKSGGAYVPLDPELPSDRIASMLEDTAPQVLLTQRAQLRKHPALESLAPCLILDELDWYAGSSEPLDVTQHPDGLAYVIYTSGSTGKPKGAGNTHRGLANRLAWMQATFQLTSADVVLQKTPYSFDVSVWEFLWPLMTGSTLVIAAPGDHRDPQRLAALIADQRVTTLHFVPSMLRAFVEAADPALCGSLRRVICSGEALDALTVQRSRELLPSAELHNLYGPTEAAIDVTHWPCGDATTPDVPIGRPIWNTAVYVLDAELQRAPVGAIGELYLAGIQLARGYHGRPALSAERFLPDPWRAGARMYRTGDLGRLRADGALEYLGRIDHQIKLRGYRIELGEIEVVLREQADVRDAVVIARHDAGNTRLVGYVVLNAPSEPAREVLFTELRARLPEYMVPAQLVVLSELPLTPSGKLDRRALPAPERSPRLQRAASTLLEAQLLDIWRLVLSAPDAGVEDDFFELGGDSLLSLQIIARARVLGLALTPRQLFEARSVAQLALVVSTSSLQSEITRVSREEWQPLSHAQERMWFLAQLDPDSAAYNISGAVRLHGVLDVPQLRAAFEGLVARHEALRTSFEEHDGRGMQRVHAQAELVLRTLNVRGPEAEQLARQAFSEEASRPFRLSDPSLLRLLLIGLSERDHVLVLTMHHLASDGATIATLLSELQALYAGQPLPAAPELQYVDYAVWQRSALSAAELLRQLDYFRAQLGDRHPLIALPTDRPRPALQSDRGAGYRFALDAQTSRAVQQLGRTLGASTFMVLLAVFEAVLYRVTGQRDLRVGIPVSRRSRSELEGVVGLFVNTLVLRSELDGTASFAELLAQLKRVSLDAQAHADLPFERLVEALSPERSLSHNPLFQVMFDYQRAPLSGVNRLGDLELKPFEREHTATQLDLTLETFGDGDKLYGCFTYATDLFDERSIAALCARFLRVLTQVVSQPERKLAELALLDDAETAALLACAGPQLEAAEAKQPFVHVLIAQHASEQPDAIALEDETGSELWSYQRLDQVSSEWAARLREHGVGPESAVGLCVGRSPRMVVGALAILKAGAAYVPLDPSQPLARLRAMVEDAGVRCILGERKTPQSLQLGAAYVLCCDEPMTGERGVQAPVQLHGEGLAYVVYTSGSTGRPKGVGVSHAALAQHIAAAGRDYGMSSRDRALHFASIGFDAGIEQWLCPLVHGARLCIRGDEPWSAERALEVLRERSITFFDLPPSYLGELARAAQSRGELLQPRACIIGGEAAARETLLTIQQAVGSAAVINGYGPTEAVVTPMTWHARAGEDCRVAYAPIGRVIGPRRSFVLDADLNLVPPGVIGELYLGGVGLARGYLGRPDITAERFVPDPYSRVAGARMYRTGDLVRVLADGNIEFVGRSDQQVKIRGYRVELGEIEARLLAQPGVREAVVVADGGAVAARLLGFVAGEVDTEQLRMQLKAALPDYMVPTQLMALDALPRTSNGKVDHRRLPVPEQQVHAYAPPQNQREAQLCAIMAEVLQVERVGRNDDFFELGGDSIRSLQVISRARKLGLALSPRAMFRCRGAAELARALESTPLAAAEPELQLLPRDTELFRLSYAQERLWFLAQLDPSSAAYNISGAVRVRGPLHVEALSTAVAELGARHEALRTTFEALDGQPWQRVHARSVVALELHDCCSGGPVSPEDQARVYVEAAADAPFDLATGPLVRVLALSVADEEHVLCLVMHHIISDGWSLDTAISELSQLYAAKQLPALSLQYVDYVAWQRARLTGAELERQLDYWRSTLGTEHPVLSLPVDYPRPQRPTQRGDVVEFALPAAQSRKLHAFSRAHDTTTFVVVLAAFQALLHRLSSQTEVRVGVPVTGRDRLETEGVIGLFVDTQVLRSDYDPSHSFSQLVARTREHTLAARANQEVPFERLVEALQPARSMAHNPLFQVMYNHLRRSDALFAGSPELQATPFAWKSQWSQFDLTLDTEEDARGDVYGRLTYATDLFARASAERWVQQFVRALEVLVAAPESALGTLSWLAPEERSAQLALAAAKNGVVPGAGLLHERIREQALRHRSRIACSYEGEQLSYGALELRANQWAQRLVKLGVGPEVLVGLCVERSLDLVVGVLAILKAGGAYVPLDPSAPSDRVAYMIDDSRLSLVLTQAALMPRFADNAGLTALCLDREDVRAESTEPPPTATRPDQLAYMIYTSGSTGKPKGALLTHRNVTRLFEVTQPSFAFDEQDVWTLFHSYAFDFSVWELFGALLHGGCVVVVPYDVSRSPSDFYSLLVREGVTVLNQTPSAFRQLAAVACATPDSDKHSLKKLRRVVFGGEALELEALRLWFERFGDQQPRLINMYGITETTVHVTYRPVSSADLRNATVSPIGEPIDDLSLHVLDEALEPCGWGVTGELYVGGPGLARGYLGRPGLSAERFVPNPFGPGRLYRSGDLALRREDGALEYLGRSDHQVKIRGFRIELGEIAAQLQAHPSVREASVIARPGPSGQRLLGYVTCHGEHGADVVDALKLHLRKVLPEYMVPASLIVLDELPLTVNGKLDQARLPEQAPRTASFVPPSTEIEQQLAAIWVELLGVERVGLRDDFFELGGHSLLITQVLSRVQRQFGVTLQLRALFDASSLQALAARIDEAGASTQSPESQLDALDALLTDLESEA